MGTMSRPFSAVLFDLDGTILDTTALILSSLRHATQAVFGTVPEDEVLIQNFGRPLEESLRALAPNLEPVQFNQFCQQYLDHNREAHDRLVALVPGVEAQLARLADQGTPMAIVTSKRRDMARRGLDFFNLTRYFPVVVAGEDTEGHKPGPEPVALGLSRLGVYAHSALYIGDSPYDMQSGRAAGCRVWGILHNTFSEAALEEAGAERVAHGWEEIGRWLDPD
jgi:pyrophosphatase PpaX